MTRIGLADTTFARYDMARAAREVIQASDHDVDIEQTTVPGFKDLPLACKRLAEQGCDLVMAFGMAGPAEVDKQCAHEAALGLGQAELMTDTPILEVFVHEDEADDDAELAWLMDRRAREHAVNALRMLLAPEELSARAGQGLREGYEDEGGLDFIEGGTLDEEDRT